MSTNQQVSAEPTADLGSHARELLAVSLMLGAVLFLLPPFGIVWATIAWATGAGLLWSSPRWSVRAKTSGTLLWPGGLIGPALLLTRVGQVCTQVVTGGTGAPGVAVGEPTCTGFALQPWLGIPVALIVIGVPFAVTSHLLRRLDGTR